jgi:hypothetical protein
MATEKKMNLDHRMAPIVGGVLVLFTAGTVFLAGALGFTDGGGTTRNVLAAVGPSSNGATALVLPSPRPSSPAGGTQLTAVADAAAPADASVALPQPAGTDQEGAPNLVTVTFGDPVEPADNVGLRTLGRSGSARDTDGLRTTARAGRQGGGDASSERGEGKETKAGNKSQKQGPPAHAKSKKPAQSPPAHAKSKKPSHAGPPAHAQNERARGKGKGKSKKRG